MLLLGLLLMAASGAFIGLLIADNLAGGPEYQVTILGNDLVRLDSLGIFLSGVALALLFCLGLAMMRLTRRAAPGPVRTAAHRRPRRVEPAAPTAPTAPQDSPDTLDTRAGTAPAAAEERAAEEPAAEQGDRAADIPREPRRRRERHLFGH